MLENGVVTIFCVDDETQDFVKKGSFRAWIYHETRLRDQGNGVRICDTFDIRISTKLIDEVRPGDLIFFGETEDFEMAKCRRIAVARKNVFGHAPHWHLEAEYMYR